MPSAPLSNPPRAPPIFGIMPVICVDMKLPNRSPACVPSEPTAPKNPPPPSSARASVPLILPPNPAKADENADAVCKPESANAGIASCSMPSFHAA